MDGTKRIVIDFIPGNQQVYPTCGNYWETDTEYHITITQQDKPEYNLLIALHEFIEYILATNRGIKEPDILKYDLEWEKKPQPKADEPGNEPDNTVYKDIHRIAENFERLLASFMNIDWKTYEDNLKI